MAEMTELNVQLMHLRGVAESPVSREFLVEQVLQVVEQFIGPAPEHDCPCDEGPLHRSPEQMFRKIEQRVSHLSREFDLLKIQVAQDKSAAELAAQGKTLKDLWGEAREVLY